MRIVLIIVIVLFFFVYKNKKSRRHHEGRILNQLFWQCCPIVMLAEIGECNTAHAGGKDEAII